MKRLYLTHITEHATHRFAERYESKTGEKVLNKAHAHKLIFDVFNIFMNDENSYVELIENVENFKDKHVKFAEKRKQKDDTHKILYKELQLVFIFDKEFKHLLTCRLDTGKFKRRRSQHKPILPFTLVTELFEFDCPKCMNHMFTYNVISKCKKCGMIINLEEDIDLVKNLKRNKI